jgi:hypothetical protein
LFLPVRLARPCRLAETQDEARRGRLQCTRDAAVGLYRQLSDFVALETDTRPAALKTLDEVQWTRKGGVSGGARVLLARALGATAYPTRVACLGVHGRSATTSPTQVHHVVFPQCYIRAYIHV